MEEQSSKTADQTYTSRKPSSRGGDAIINDGDTKRTNPIKKSPSHDFLINLEAQIVRLKNSLESWREIVLPLHSVLLWEQNWHPAAIAGGSTFIFLSLWLLDPSILTTLSILGLTITISDYLVPTIAATLFKSETWTVAKEEQYSDFCRAIVVYNAKIAVACASFYLMRTTRPKMFYGCTIITLAMLAWIGNSLNNLFLTYVLVTIMLFIPGMEHHGLLKKYGKALTKKITDCTSKSAEIKKD